MMPMTRRRFLRLLAAGGSGVSLLSERAAADSKIDIPVTFANPDPIAGHVLRQTHDYEHWPRKGPIYDVVIVGGGISGLSAAWKLTQAGVDRILVLELGNEVGGTSSAGNGETTAFPWGAHYVNVPPREADCIHEVFGDLGIIVGYDAAGRPIVHDEHRLQWPRERLWRGDHWVDDIDPFVNKADMERYEQFADDMLGWTLENGRDDRRAFTLPLEYSSRDQRFMRLDKMSFRDYLNEQGWVSPSFDWAIDYACRDDYGSLSSQVSAWAGIHYFSCRFYDYRLETEYPTETLTWPEGNAFLAKALSSQLTPDQVHTGLAVVRVERQKAGARLACINLADESCFNVHCRTVIYAGKLHTAPFVVNDLPLQQREAMASCIYSPWLVAALHLNHRPASAQSGLAWDNVLMDSPSLGYVVADHQLPHNSPKSVWTYYLPLCDAIHQQRVELSQQRPSHWAQYILQDLSGPHPDLASAVDHIQLYRWGHAMVRHVPDFIWGDGRRLRNQPFPPLFFASADGPGLPLFEEACFSGINAAQEVMDHLQVSYRNSLKGRRNG